MIPIRFHLTRNIAGTASIERKQVLLQANPDGSGTVLVKEWRKSGGSLTQREYVESGETTHRLWKRMVGDAALDGWFCRYEQELPREDLKATAMLTIIEANVDLIPDLEQIAAATTEVDFPVEEQGAVYLGPDLVNLTRSRRKRGEDRPLRYDTIKVRTVDGSLASKLLCLLVMKHGGKFMYEDDDPEEGINLASYASDLLDYERLVPLIESWGIKLQRFTGMVLRTPGGLALKPAVF